MWYIIPISINSQNVVTISQTPLDNSLETLIDTLYQEQTIQALEILYKYQTNFLKKLNS